MNFSLILTLLASVSAGISVTLIALFIFDVIKKMEIAQASDDSETQDEIARMPIIIRMVLPLTPNFMRIAKSDALSSTCKNTQSLLEQTGLDQACTSHQFVAARLVLGAIGCFFAVLLAFSGKLPLGLAMVLLLMIYPQIWLKKYRDKRHLEIQRALPNMLDLLTLSVEAGKDFLTSMRDILRRRKLDALGQELSRTFHEIQLGKSRRDALKGLSMRVQQPDLSSLMNAVVQADELGVSIGNVLRIQGDQLRLKRFQRAETLANEAPVKILFPMVIFIFPAVFLILLAPLLRTVLGTVL